MSFQDVRASSRQVEGTRAKAPLAFLPVFAPEDVP